MLAPSVRTRHSGSWPCRMEPSPP